MAVDLSAEDARDELIKELRIARPERLWNVADGFRAGLTLEELFELTAIDPWFLAQIADLVAEENTLRSMSVDALGADRLQQLKRKGFSDRRLASLMDCTEGKVRRRRHDLHVRPVFKRVDTCAAEFSTSTTAYMYSTYEEECEAAPSDRQRQDNGAGWRPEPDRAGYRV